MDYEPSHFGICVSDLERSMRFYCDGLGFTKMATYACGDEFEASLEVSGPIVLTAQFIQKGGMVVELLHYQSPAVTGSPSQHRNQLGLTHLSFVVDDVDAAATRLAGYGGRILPATRVSTDTGIEIVFLEDPDGTRIELDNAPA
ncbi:MAG: VOC family protein [Acidimicrobiales bacterium]